MRLGLLFLCAWCVTSLFACTESPRAETAARPSPEVAATEQASSKAAVGPQVPFNLGAVMSQVRHGFRKSGAQHEGGDTTYQTRVQAARVELTPFHRPSAGDRKEGDALTLETLSVTRGDQSLLTTAPSTTDGENGALRIARGEVTEVLENTDAGLEQSFVLARRPEGHGDLAVRVAVRGQAYRGESSGGLHFVGAKHGLGFRYGRATFVDASGRRTDVKARFSAGVIMLEVGSEVLDGASYPAVLDPVVGPEFGMDQPAVAGIMETGQVAATNADGTALVVWSVNYNDDADLYAARVGANGIVLDPAGIALATGPYGQAMPAVASDGAGWFVAWRELQHGSTPTGILGTHVGEDATVQHPNGVNIATLIADGPAVACDGTNCLVAWNAGRNIVGVRLDSTDTVLDADTRYIGEFTPVSNLVPYPGLSLAFDGSTWVAVWGTYHTATHSLDLVGSRLDSTAAPIDSFAITDPVMSVFKPNLTCRDGGACLVTWEGGGIRAARLSSGVVLDPSGIAIAGDTLMERHAPVASWDGTNWVVGWLLGAANYPQSVEVIRLSTDGALVDSSPVTLSTQAWSIALTRSVARTLVVWGGSGVDRAGTGPGKGTLGALWTGTSPPSNPFVISVAYANTWYPAVAASESQWLVVWEDTRDMANSAPNQGIYGTRIGPTGAVLDPNGIAISAPNSPQYLPQIASDGTDWLVVWQDGRNGDFDVYGTRVTADGQVPDSAATLIGGGPENQLSPHVAFNGSDWLVVWGSDDYDLNGASRVATDGTVLDPHSIHLALNGSGSGQTGAVTGGAGEWLVAGPTLTSSGDVSGQRIAGDGTIIDSTPFPITVSPDRVEGPVDASYGDGQWLVVWRNADSYTISGARIDSSGALLDPDGIVITSNGTEDFPKVAYDGVQWLVTWWTMPAGGNTSYDVVATRVNASGQLLDPAGFTIAGGPGAENLQSLAGRDGRWLVVYGQSAGPIKEARARIVQTDCVAFGATDTTCDGIDDDCDGSFDEDYVSTPTSCGTAGCATTGATSCISGAVVDSCQADPTDGDSDGTPSCADGCPTDPLKTAPGTCGCGNPDTDSDSDGVDDCVDACPSVPAMTSDGCPPSGAGGSSATGGSDATGGSGVGGANATGGSAGTGGDNSVAGGAGTGSASAAGGTGGSAGENGGTGSPGTGGTTGSGVGGAGNGGVSGGPTAGEGGEGGVSGEAGGGAGGVESEGGNTNAGQTSSAGKGSAGKGSAGKGGTSSAGNGGASAGGAHGGKGGAGKGGTATGGVGGTSGHGSSNPPPDEGDDGCGCRVPREPPSRPWSTAVAAAVIGLALRRRTSRVSASRR